MSHSVVFVWGGSSRESRKAGTKNSLDRKSSRAHADSSLLDFSEESLPGDFTVCTVSVTQPRPHCRHEGPEGSNGGLLCQLSFG